jgi:hypothetical protein
MIAVRIVFRANYSANFIKQINTQENIPLDMRHHAVQCDFYHYAHASSTNSFPASLASENGRCAPHL